MVEGRRKDGGWKRDSDIEINEFNNNIVLFTKDTIYDLLDHTYI